MKISSLRSGDDWQLEHVHLQEAGKDMPRMPEGVRDAEDGGVEEREGVRDDRRRGERRERAAGGGLQRCGGVGRGV